jgi:hypothetical protein
MAGSVPELVRSGDTQNGQLHHVWRSVFAGRFYTTLITPAAAAPVPELLGVQLQPLAAPSLGPLKRALMQTSCCQPDTQAIVHQYLHAMGTPVGEKISAVRLRRTEYRH